MDQNKINYQFNRPTEINTSQSIKNINDRNLKVPIESNTVVFQKSNINDNPVIEEIDLSSIIYQEDNTTKSVINDTEITKPTINNDTNDSQLEQPQFLSNTVNEFNIGTDTIDIQAEDNIVFDQSDLIRRAAKIANINK